jgi:predicted enzyme related to lactoylglutathione lyase
MLGDAPIVAFVSATDLGRARAFYEGVLGLTVMDVNDFACVVSGAGTMLRITHVESMTPQPFTVLGWQILDMKSTVDVLVARGVEFQRYGGMEQDERGVWTAPGRAQIAWFTDPDGNVLSLTQFEPDPLDELSAEPALAEREAVTE